MNEREIYNLRLLAFADHIATIKYELVHELTADVELITLTNKTRTHYKVKYRHWVFEELPALFDEWYYHEATGDPTYPGADARYGAPGAVIDYFGLKEDEFCHCFDIEGLQQKRFGGHRLNFESSGHDIATNIIELVKYRRKEARDE